MRSRVRSWLVVFRDTLDEWTAAPARPSATACAALFGASIALVMVVAATSEIARLARDEDGVESVWR